MRVTHRPISAVSSTKTKSSHAQRPGGKWSGACPQGHRPRRRSERPPHNRSPPMFGQRAKHEANPALQKQKGVSVVPCRPPTRRWIHSGSVTPHQLTRVRTPRGTESERARGRMEHRHGVCEEHPQHGDRGSTCKEMSLRSPPISFKDPDVGILWRATCRRADEVGSMPVCTADARLEEMRTTP